MADDPRIARLARQIDDEIRRDQHLLLTEIEVADARRKGAAELFSICADFVASVNGITPGVLELTPPQYAPHMYREPGFNLIQINAHGRIIQIAFEATREKFSTEKFRIPYILEGEVRAYNQEMLERTQVRSQALFFCLERDQAFWQHFEFLSGRMGRFGREHLVGLLERLV
jgi:hypothetical protein